MTANFRRWAVLLICAWGGTMMAGSSSRAAQPQTSGPEQAPPTLVIFNARIWAGAAEEAAETQALAVDGPRIRALGTNETMRKLVGKDTLQIDAGGRRVIPGITDSHTHFLESGLQLGRIDLHDVNGRTAFVELLTAAAAKLTPGQWLLGGRWTVESWAVPETPRKEWIDPGTPGTPVYVSRMDGHQALANSVALKFARIDRKGPPDPPGGEIERDPDTGEPTGILKDAAMDLVSRHVPPPGREENCKALRLACQVANAWGITSVHDMSQVPDLDVFAAVRSAGELTVRIHSYVTAEDFAAAWPTLERFGWSAAGNGRQTADPLLRVQGYKAFMDGSLGSRTAYMREPFADAAPDEKYPRGLRAAWAVDLPALTRQVRWAHDRGVQLAIHAIGDEAIHELLNIYAELPDGAARRHRIEHTQHLLPEDVRRFAELGVIVSMQPFHKADDGRWAEKALGPRRSETTYAWASLLRDKALVCFGSDVPVVTCNPFSGMATAVTGRTLDGRTWVPAQNITLRQALRCYTATPAQAVFREAELGTLEPGKLADIAILDRDILNISIAEVPQTEAWLTLLGGKVVWRKPGG